MWWQIVCVPRCMPLPCVAKPTAETQHSRKWPTRNTMSYLVFTPVARLCECVLVAVVTELVHCVELMTHAGGNVLAYMCICVRWCVKFHSVWAVYEWGSTVCVLYICTYVWREAVCVWRIYTVCVLYVWREAVCVWRIYTVCVLYVWREAVCVWRIYTVCVLYVWREAVCVWRIYTVCVLYVWREAVRMCAGHVQWYSNSTLYVRSLYRVCICML